MNTIDRQYKELLEHIIHFGVEKKDRTGTGTKSIFGWQIRHNMKEGFPLLTTKKMAWKSIVTELLWFLRGDTNIKYLVDNGCHIWDGDAWENYRRKTLEKFTNDDTAIAGYTITSKEEFIKKIKGEKNGFSKRDFVDKWGELGPIYGKQWRKWKTDKVRKEYTDLGPDMPLHTSEYPVYVDQIQNLINELKTNPDSRRLMVSAWNVGELDQMVLPPCHYGFQVWTRPSTREEKIVDPGKYHRISLMWNQRSVDTFLGLPFNIASYALLLEIIAKEVNMIPEDLVGNLGDTHLYLNHIEQAKEQITRTPYPLPKLVINNQVLFGKGIDEMLNSCLIQGDFIIENYKSHSAIKAPLSN